MNKQTLEQIRFIEDLLRTNAEKEQSVYYTIKIERYGEFTSIVDRGSGADTFLTDMEKAIKTHKPDQIIVELYSSKSKRIKYPTNTYKLSLDKTRSHNNGQLTILKPSLNGLDEEKPVIKEQEVIPIRQYVQETLESGRQQMQLEFNLKTLEYEIKQKDKEITDLNREIAECRKEIAEYEKEIGQLVEKTEQPGMGSVALGHVGSSLLEKFVVSKTGQALLGSIGADLDKLNGLLGNIKEEEKNKEKSEEKPASRIITDNTEDKPSGKKLEEFNLQPLYNEPRVDLLSHGERISVIGELLRKSDERYSMIVLQLFRAMVGEPQISNDLQIFHSAIVNAYNQLKREKENAGNQNAGKVTTIKVVPDEDEKEEDQEEDNSNNLV